jgi:hypothetical protein
MVSTPLHTVPNAMAKWAMFGDINLETLETFGDIGDMGRHWETFGDKGRHWRHWRQ